MAAATSSGAGGSSRDGSAKTMVADQITQSVQSTSNLLHLMLQSSPSQAQLQKLPKSLLAKTSTIKNTSLVLEQLPQIISSLDAHMDQGLQCVPQLKTVIQLLSNIENCQLKPLSNVQLSQEVLVVPPNASIFSCMQPKQEGFFLKNKYSCYSDCCLFFFLFLRCIATVSPAINLLLSSKLICPSSHIYGVIIRLQ
nr:tobamovirus multiplication protein 2B [Ipomoea batatas]